jgi:dihydrofolate reductase
MRKLRIGALVTLDGVQQEPRSWAAPYFDETAAEESLAKLLAADAMLMGRRTYEYFAPAWPLATGPYADRVNAIPKYVFSSTLESVEWTGATLVRDDAVRSVRELKEQDGGDLVVYGFGRLGRALLEHELVDDLDLWVHPVLVGGDAPAPWPGPPLSLTLQRVEQRSKGVVSLRYTR